jgi:hypothetical protein
MEQRIEVMMGFVPPRQLVQALHAIPQRVAVQHEARARHDVGPVACLVLLEQEEALVLLRHQPLDRPFDVWLPAIANRTVRARPAHVIDRDQPPQGCIDATDVPEVGPGAIGLDVLGDLSVRRLPGGERVEARDRAEFERRDAAAGHRERADGCVAAEDTSVGARIGCIAAPCGKDAMRRQIVVQQPQRFVRATIEQVSVVVGCCRVLVPQCERRTVYPLE